MKKLLFLLSICFVISCSDEDLKTCSNISEKSWFKEFKMELDENCSIETSVFQGQYEGQVVFYPLITDPKVNYQAMLDLYNCEGELIAQLSAEESNQYLDARSGLDTRIYTCTE